MPPRICKYLFRELRDEVLLENLLSPRSALFAVPKPSERVTLVLVTCLAHFVFWDEAGVITG